MPDRPSKRYLDGVAEGRWTQDAGQLAALVELDRVALALLERQRAGFLRKLGFRLAGHAGVRGLYLWGGVGRGKTLLCDLLLEACAELKPQVVALSYVDPNRVRRDLEGLKSMSCQLCLGGIAFHDPKLHDEIFGQLPDHIQVVSASSGGQAAERLELILQQKSL